MLKKIKKDKPVRNPKAKAFAAAEEKPKKTKGRKLATFFVVMMLVAMSMIWLTPSFINSDKYRDILLAKTKELTGQEMRIKGDISVELMPSPRLRIQKVELGGPLPDDSAPPTPLLRAEEMVLNLPWDALLSDTPKVTGVTMVNPILEIEREQHNEVNWGWLKLPSGDSTVPTSISIENGKVFYYDQEIEQSEKLENIYLRTGQSAEGISLSGYFIMLGEKIDVRAVFPPLSKDKGSQLTLEMSHEGESKMLVELSRTETPGGKSIWKGTSEGEIHNPGLWIQRYEEIIAAKNEDPLTRSPDAGKKGPAPAPYPLKLASAMSFDGKVIKMEQLVVSTPDSAGKGVANIIPGDIWRSNVALEFEKLYISQPLLNAFLRKYSTRAGSAGTVTFAETETRLPQKTYIGFAVRANEFLYGGETFSDVLLEGSLKEGEIRLDVLTGRLTGNSIVSLSGKIVDTAKGLRFQGRTETSGSSLKNLLALFDPAASKLPNTGFSEYYIEANVFVSSEQLRLSEAEVRLGDLVLIGGLVTYFEAIPRVEAEISLKDTNLDYFRDKWRAQFNQKGEKDFVFKVNSSVDFRWLRELRPIIDLNINLNRFTFLERGGKKGSFSLYARQNILGLNNIVLEFPEGDLRGDVTVDVDQELPHLTANLQIPILDTSYFAPKAGEMLGSSLINKDNPRARWSTEIFDFGWMIGLTADVNIASRRIVHQNQNYDSFLLQSSLVEEQLNFSRLTFSQLGGKVEAKGTLIGGKVPGLNMNFTLFNADIGSMLQTFSNIDALSGRMSISGTVVTSGINFEEWVKQADAKTAIAARGVRVDGFYLDGVVDAIYASRSVADVVTKVNSVITQGSTTMAVDGNINIINGVVRTPGLSINTGKAYAATTGELRLLSWKMAANTVFQMRMLESETVPTLTVDIAGSPTEYKMKIDTSSLEAFVAKRVVGQ